MTKIRPLRFSDIKKIKKMMQYIAPEGGEVKLPDFEGAFFPFNLIHCALPLGFKFIQECYIAEEGNNLLGLIGLVRDGKQKTRWKINRLVLNVNAYDVGKQLVDYVVNKYGGAGVETFVTAIDENYAEAVALFKNACGFRSCSQIQLWETDNDCLNEDYLHFKNMVRKVLPSDAQILQECDENCLYPQFRPSLYKSVEDFRFDINNKMSNYFKGFKVERFLLEDVQRKMAEGYLFLMTKDNSTFWADIVLSLPYQEYYKDAVNFITACAKEQNPNAKIYIYSRGYYQTHPKLIETLKNSGCRVTQTFQVLVKDYWKLSPASELKKSPIVIFPDLTSPACNTTNFYE